ncbi:Probable prolyl 4-hydroxylase 10 [Olea europaea subsp. europaea]|uniref:Probable prolyl 4-hydroxylase 10 n=1 Tax=Olea europaea subsp. europaea TaxID=158383 RepID=A0A8S0QM16_OLEEU|nr:Probable prolyl 4-hydroxylase 10 [Olea europaea subsp. europaea]
MNLNFDAVFSSFLSSDLAIITWIWMVRGNQLLCLHKLSYIIINRNLLSSSILHFNLIKFTQVEWEDAWDGDNDRGTQAIQF